MLLHKNVWFYVFIIFQLYFVVKIYGNSTAADVDDYLVPVYDMDKYMEYYVPQTRSTRARPTPARTTGDEPTPVRTMPAKPTRDRTPPAGIAQKTSHKRITTTSAIRTPPTEPSFKPIDYLSTIKPEQINSFVTNLALLNKTIVEQTKLIYGKDRPDKYRNVVNQLLNYFKSIAGPDWQPGPDPTYSGNSPQTEPPLEDYDMLPDHKHQTIPNVQQLQSPQMYYDDDYYPETKLPIYSTLKPVTDNHNLLNRSELNKARQGAQYNISTKYTIPHQTKPSQEQTQTPSVKIHDQKHAQIQSNKLHDRQQTRTRLVKLHDRQKKTPSIKLHYQQQKTPSIKLNYQQQNTPSIKLHYQQQKTPSIKLHYQQQKTPSIKLNYQQQNTPSIKLNYQQQNTPSIKLHYQQQNTPSIKLNYQQQNTPSIKLHYQQQKTPSIKLNYQQQNTPSIKLHYQQQKTPSIKLHYQQQKTPSIKLNYQQQNTPSIKLNYQQQNTPSIKLHYQQQNTPSIKLNYQQQNTPSIKLHYQQQKTPSIKLNYQQQNTPSIKLHYQQQKTPSIKLHYQQQKTPSIKLNYQQQNTPSIKLHYQQQKTPSIKLNYQQQKTPSIKLHDQQKTQPPMILHVRQQTRTPNKLYVRQQNESLSIPDQQVTQSQPPQQETQSQPPQQVDAYADLILVTMEYPNDAGYYDLDAVTGGKGYTTSIVDLNSTLGTTEPPKPTTVHYIIQEVKTNMVEKQYGYMKGFLLGLCTIISSKDPSQAQVLYAALRDVTMNMVKTGTFTKMGKRVENTVVSMSQHLTVLSPTAVQGFAALGVQALEVIDILPLDVQRLLSNLDELYTVEEGEQLIASLVPVAEYPNSDNASVVAQNMMDKIFQPYFRAEGSQSAQSLLKLIDRVMETRNWGNRRLINDLNNGFFDNNDFYKDLRKKDNVKVKRLFNQLNDKGRREVIIRELIENVKAMEVLKKYESKRARFTTNKWTNFYKVFNKPNNYNKRADFDQIKAMGDKKIDDLNKKPIQIEDKREKMADFDDGTSNEQVKRTENAEIKNLKGPRNNKIHSGMDIDTDRLYGLTSESESESENGPKTYRNKMDKHTKHKIRHHLKHNHRKLYKKLKKLHDRNKRLQLKLKNKVIRKNKGQKRFDVVEEPQKQPPYQDKTRAKDSDSKNQHSSEENQRLSDDNRRPYRRPPNTNRPPPGVNRRPPGNNIKRPDINKRLPDIIRRPPATYKRPPGANRRYPVDVIRPPDVKKRPPGAKTRPPYDIIKPPYTTEPPSLYLTPKYVFNSRRFNENLNLTRRSNAKPISTELSYSNEENDIKFILQDTIRHPIDLKSKIQQNSLVFDKVQNGRRQMAPVDRISLKDESSFSDDEGVIKNNIYKVFNKNN